ncbi:hypothetical protein Tco_0345432 [Tanacetum coccineum]
MRCLRVCIVEIWTKLETLYMTKSLPNRLYLKKKLYNFYMHPGKKQSEHTDEFHKLVGDLAAIDTAILDKDQALLLLTSLPSSYGNFVETLLYGRETLKLEDGYIGLEGYEAGKRYNYKKSQVTIKYKDQVSGYRADGYDSADVMMVMSDEQLLDWIMNSGGSYHMTYMRDYFSDFEEYDGSNVLLGGGRECRVQGTGKVRVQMRDGSSFVLDNVRHDQGYKGFVGGTIDAVVVGLQQEVLHLPRQST